MPLDPDRCIALFVERAQPFAVQLARRYPDVAAHADDAVQHAFQRLREQEPPPQDPPGWVWRVAANWMHDRLRESARFVAEDAVAADASPSVGPPTLTSTTTRTFTLETVQQLLRDLPPRDQELLYRKYVEKQDYTTIAEATGRRVGSLGTTLSRLRDRLRTALDRRLEERRARQ